MFAKTIMTLAILACAAAASAGPASIWGSGSTQKETQDAPKTKSVSPYVKVAPKKPIPFQSSPPIQENSKAQEHPMSEPTPAPEPTWSLQNVPSDPAPLKNEAMTPGELPPVVMNKAEVMALVKDPEMRKYLEQFSRGDVLIMPQNPPEMDENTSKILPYSQTEPPNIPDINSQNIIDLYQECPNKNCPKVI